MHSFFVWAGVAGAWLAAAPCASEPTLAPGLYQVEVRISLPNVQDVADPMVSTRCIGPSELQTGWAFSVLSENPLKNCPLSDYRLTGDTASYRIACPGPNMGSAVGVFALAGASYRGTIKMNMGGKNMTMLETQVGKRMGDCR